MEHTYFSSDKFMLSETANWRMIKQEPAFSPGRSIDNHTGYYLSLVSSTIIRAAVSKSASTIRLSKPEFSICNQSQLFRRGLEERRLRVNTTFNPFSQLVPCRRTTTGTLKPPVAIPAAMMASAIISHRTIPVSVSARHLKCKVLAHLHRY